MYTSFCKRYLYHTYANSPAGESSPLRLRRLDGLHRWSGQVVSGHGQPGVVASSVGKGAMENEMCWWIRGWNFCQGGRVVLNIGWGHETVDHVSSFGALQALSTQEVPLAWSLLCREVSDKVVGVQEAATLIQHAWLGSIFGAFRHLTRNPHSYCAYCCTNFNVLRIRTQEWLYRRRGSTNITSLEQYVGARNKDD